VYKLPLNLSAKEENAMLRPENRPTSGFTLIELAIVLGVVGILFGGLWRLLSTGNLQMRDQATASQQSQMIAAVNSYLQTSEGQALMGTIAANGTAALGLPSLPKNAAGTSTCTADPNMASDPGLCALLPAGTWSGSTNPYGQTYSIRILKDNTAAPKPPQSYSFMIITSPLLGDAISDASGGRISAMIGGDGGFIYNNTSGVCGTPVAQYACGSYGSWTATPLASAAPNTNYGFPAGSLASGRIASRTYYAPGQNISDYWLARKHVPGDNDPASGSISPFYNTMETALFLGNQIVYFGNTSITATNATGKGVMDVQGGTINMLDHSAAEGTGGGTINMQGGTVYLGTNSTIQGIASTGGNGAGGGTVSLNGFMKYVAGMANSVLLVNDTSGCILSDPSLSTTSCGYVVTVNGNMTVAGLLYVYSLYAQTFSYYTSDARLKEDVKGLDAPLSELMKLRPVSYTLKENGKKSMGLIAQEVENVYPNLVSEGSTGYKAVAYDGLIAPLIGAVQELKKENDSLRQQIEKQNTRQEKLKQELDALKHKEKTAP
jgi:prepilin-type N-terminal cleavage/methylation domain-containing protein